MYRLPTEIEWEYACRGGPLCDKAESSFDFYLQQPTNQLPAGEGNLQHDKDNNLRRTCQVGSFQPNRLGLYDLHGNVAEWCDDAAVDNKGASRHVARGGDWLSPPSRCWAAFRSTYPPLHQGSNLGLRLARVPLTPAPK